MVEGVVFVLCSGCGVVFGVEGSGFLAWRFCGFMSVLCLAQNPKP